MSASSVRSRRCLMPVCRARWAERMDRAEMGREIDLLGIAELLSAKHHDRVAVDRVLDGVAVGGLQRPREVDAGNLGEELGRGWRNGDAHDRLLRL